ncbi:MAG: DUF2799 domain-containing protein [Rhodoferax sp.]|nr:DUF2799 domain-containing protein [Rhodoferax sp.]PIW06426.1 MAG: hypothetical protein COW39_17125 [Comamonadaceae bacterium CG17_big_fil_post_rev_8_21_14_2_50_60_13]PJC11707.1 MAG: hypothetical protein CO066_14110 [Comamonadaceae bacterium CG_4_9_14_0_8_um_filter_60_18]
MLRRIFLLLLLLALFGCASMSETQCQVADWQRVGLQDGAIGMAESHLADYVKDCAKVGVTPDAVAYRKGWDAGILRFCTPANGWREGTQGRHQADAVCRAQSGYERFTYYLSAGLQFHRTGEQIRANNHEMRRLQSLLDTTTKDEEKKQLRFELQQLDWEQFRLRNLINQQRLLAP